jgi:hypothetical protein
MTIRHEGVSQLTGKLAQRTTVDKDDPGPSTRKERGSPFRFLSAGGSIQAHPAQVGQLS